MEGITIIETSVFQELISKIDSMRDILETLDQELKDTRKPYLTIQDVMQLTGFGIDWVNDHKGDIGYFNVGRSIRFKRKDVQEYMEGHSFKLPRRARK